MTYIAGQHWFICDVCGHKYRSTVKRKRWDGLVVCPDDWETEHPQKFVRLNSVDGQAVPDPRPRPADVYVDGLFCTIITNSPMADVGVADCMTVDAIASINYLTYNSYAPIYPETASLPSDTSGWVWSDELVWDDSITWID